MAINIDKSDRIIILILAANFMILLSSIFLSGAENGSFSLEQFEETSIMFLSDIVRNINIFEFVVENKRFPGVGEVEPNMPAHPPLYYFLLTPVIVFSNLINQNVMLMLELSSIIIFFIASIIFWRVLKMINKYVKKNNFVVYSFMIFTFLPTTLASSRLVTPDVLFFLLFTIFLYFFTKLIENKSKFYALIIGIVLGMAFWTWLSVIPLLVALFIFIVILHLLGEYKERNLLSLSLIIGVLVGGASLIRNLVVYGGDLIGNAAYSSVAQHPGTEISIILLRIWSGYWGGIYGGVEELKLLMIIFIIFLNLFFIYGLINAFNNKSYDFKKFLVFSIIFFIVFSFFGIHHNCDIFKFLSTGGCYGWGTQGRYLIPLNPFIGIFASIGLISLEKINKKFKWLNYLFVFLISVLFAIDFLVAFR